MHITSPKIEESFATIDANLTQIIAYSLHGSALAGDSSIADLEANLACRALAQRLGARYRTHMANHCSRLAPRSVMTMEHMAADFALVTAGVQQRFVWSPPDVA